MNKVIRIGSKNERIEINWDGSTVYPFTIDFEESIGTFHCMTAEQFKELHKAVNELYNLHFQGKEK